MGSKPGLQRVLSEPATRRRPGRRRMRFLVLIAALAVAGLLIVRGLGGGRSELRARGTFYVSPSGSDDAAGTSPDTAWRTVAKVDREQLQPGDVVLFQGGGRFSDAVLEPRASGAAGVPIVFGSYGDGQATLGRGVFFVRDHLRFERLTLTGTFYGGSEARGRSNDIAVSDVTIRLPPGDQGLGLYANGDQWVIEGSTIENTGLSGMLLNGQGYTIDGNTIRRTGLDQSNGYNNHGIYLDASDATITHNTIEDFAESAISVRYHGSTITGNTISGGRIGIDFFQTDAVAASSSWSGNTISATTTAGIFVSAGGAAGATAESFSITSNRIRVARGVNMNLHPTTGRYEVSDNSCSPTAGSCAGPVGMGM